jgi:hypothetical protein
LIQHDSLLPIGFFVLLQLSQKGSFLRQRAAHFATDLQVSAVIAPMGVEQGYSGQEENPKEPQAPAQHQPNQAALAKRERRRAYQREWQRKYYQQHPERVRETNRKWKEQNRERVLAQKREYQREYRRRKKEAKGGETTIFPDPKAPPPASGS